MGGKAKGLAVPKKRCLQKRTLQSPSLQAESRSVEVAKVHTERAVMTNHVRRLQSMKRIAFDGRAL